MSFSTLFSVPLSATRKGRRFVHCLPMENL